MRLDGASAVVTGGSSGIGRGIALELANEGAAVAIGDLRREPSERDAATPTDAVIRERGGEGLFCEVDVADEAEAAALLETAADEHGGVDILVNNAGIAHQGTIEETDTAAWQRILDVNLTGIYNCSVPALPHLRRSTRPRIVNVASQLGLVGRPDRAAYCASKGGVVNLTRAMAVDHADEGITVNAICPGVIETSMTRASLEDEESRAYLESRTPLPMIGQPADIGRAVTFLVSEGGRYVTGHCLTVDGGWTAW